MISKLLEAGYPVKAYDKYPETAATVIAAGAVWQDTPQRAATGSDIVITCLPLPQHVLENMCHDQGALHGMHPGAIWIDTSTTDYHNTLNIAGTAARQGVFSLEAPVRNLSHMGVDFCNMSFFVAGDRTAYERSRKVLDTLGKISFYVGEIGRAQTVKLLTNLLFYSATVVAGEMLCLADEAGVPLHWMWAYIQASPGNSVATEQFLPFLFDGSYDRSCSVEIAVKDMSLTVALADELGVAIPVRRIIEQRYRQAGTRYLPLDNHLLVIQLSENEEVPMSLININNADLLDINNINDAEARDSFDAIHGAMGFNEDPERLNRYYEQWASQYDADVRNEEYAGPEFLARYLASLLETQELAIVSDAANVHILDAGCGTGLLGVALFQQGYRCIDGFDLADAMVRKAMDRGVYFTVLIQEALPAPSLRVYTKNQWIDAPCLPDCFVINLGDMLQHWTNGLFVSTRHEVLHHLPNSRLSIPFFVYSNIDVEFRPMNAPDQTVSVKEVMLKNFNSIWVAGNGAGPATELH